MHRRRIHGLGGPGSNGFGSSRQTRCSQHGTALWTSAADRVFNSLPVSLGNSGEEGIPAHHHLFSAVASSESSMRLSTPQHAVDRPAYSACSKAFWLT